MEKPFGFVATLCALGAVPIAAASALAQQSASMQPVASIAPGAKVYDNAGQQVGTVAQIAGDKVAVAVGNNGIVVPLQALVQTEKGPALNASKAEILASVEQSVKENAAALNSALKAGAEVHSAGGSKVLGTVKQVGDNSATLATTAGDVKIPRNLLFVSKAGLATNLTAGQFEEAVRKSLAASAPPSQ
ncbi:MULTISPECIES: hypothetical protein [unclassified Sphingopyxis]|uniref:hypothetical protein n=1 Tax=unclassified Sphingopyxis TaxID=2614943 RepID=UPI00086BCAC6|nr:MULTISPECIES: hypothetical protein [unclassified Sphingopyxis]MDR7062459.1 preprotein translocase subunit YajC [Sphingopyxis sp. BE235]MDR7182841.1 preprotein translocase subunit YajC [Sphingopyxis sp. BE249]ODU34709.1 MAG: hypothetical protein ABS88_02000 [Sphingopyxis sp. SCN 67-31]